MRPFGAARIFLYDQPVDMRKSFEGLGLLVDRGYPGTLLSGSLFVFLNRNRTHSRRGSRPSGNLLSHINSHCKLNLLACIE